MRLSIAKNLRHATFIKLPIFIRGLVTRRNSISDWVKRRSDIVVLNQWVAAINKNLFWLHRMGPTRDSVHFSNSERFVSKPHSEQQSSRRSGGPTRSLLSCSWNAGTHLICHCRRFATAQLKWFTPLGFSVMGPTILWWQQLDTSDRLSRQPTDKTTFLVLDNFLEGCDSRPSTR